MNKKEVMPFIRKTLNGMAYGLFATLIIGTIFATIGSIFASYDNGFANFMVDILGHNNAGYIRGYNKGLSYVLQILTGAGIGVGIALSLKFDALKTITLGVVGELASYFSVSSAKIKGLGFLDFSNNSIKIGDPLTIYVVCIVTALFIGYVLKKKTPVDILIIPLFSCLVGLGCSIFARYIAYATFAIQYLVGEGTSLMPFVMGIVVSVLMGMALTAPISSAAIAAIVFTGAIQTGSGLALASGAAVVGCSVQMVGFAIESIHDNNIGQVISIGIGTSMLQFKNILKKPIIWLPTIIVSAIMGPISTCLLKLECFGASAGMGTAGLVGQIGTFSSMGNTWQTWVGIFVIEIVLPIILVFAIDLLFRKLNLIKKGDFSLKNE